MKIAVAQLGARMHYAVPRILHEAGALHRLYTDICAVKGWPRWLRVLPQRFRSAGVERLLGRIPRGIPRDRITAFTYFGLRYFWRRAQASSFSKSMEAHIWAGRTFGERVVARGLNAADAVYTFNSAGLELLRHARRQALRGIVEQTIVPHYYEKQLLEEEHALHPEWEPFSAGDNYVPDYFEREQAEWECADTIVCGSPFVRDGIGSCGGPVEKCIIVPYGVDASFSVPKRPPHGGPLRVLTVGAVGLRKGSPYVLDAARQCGEEATFRMVGAVGVSDDALAALNQHVDVMGRVPRSEIQKQYAWADVFLLPSICEGSATVTYEALAAGLPVICTPNTGSIVRDGEEGFIVPIRDSDQVADRIDRLAADEQLRRAMSDNARKRYEQAGSLEAYAERLLEATSSDDSSVLL